MYSHRYDSTASQPNRFVGRRKEGRWAYVCFESGHIAIRVAVDVVVGYVRFVKMMDGM